MNHDLLASAVVSLNFLFTVLRVVANGPQLMAILRDPCGAQAIAVGSWTVFAMANASNGIYALVMAADPLMCTISLVSAASCGTIALAALVRQRRHRKVEASRHAGRAVHAIDAAGGGLIR